MTKTIQPKAIIFDINGVLLKTDRQAALRDYLQEKSQTDHRITVDWAGDAEKLMFGLLYRNCPLCNFDICKVSAANGYPHIKIALESGQLTFEGMKVGITQMLTHHVKCPPQAQITLDYIAEFLTRPELRARNAEPLLTGIALLKRAVDLVGEHNAFILSNMPAETFSIYTAKFASVFDLVPTNNIILSSHTGIRKPAPEAFTILATKYNVSPKESLFIDDKKKNVKAARDVGMYAVQFSEQASTELTAWYKQLGFERA